MLLFYFFFLKALSPDAVALSRITVFLLKKEATTKKTWKTLVSAWGLGKKKLHKGEPDCVVNVPSRHATLEHVISHELASLITKRAR